MIHSGGLRRRGQAAATHLLISFVAVAAAAWLVFHLWYPGPFKRLAGGRELFMLLVSVDLVLGPLLTFVVFDMRKAWPHLRRDLAVIALIQAAALGYGLHTVFVARPIAMVFEVDRFQLVTASNVATEELPLASPEYRHLPWTGPVILGTRTPSSAAEASEALVRSLGGVDVSSRPTFWQSYALSRESAQVKSRPLKALLQKYPSSEPAIRLLLQDENIDVGAARFLPVVARGDWVAVIDNDSNVVGYLPLDGFFY